MSARSILIVGQGLAGSLLAWEGLTYGHHITVIEGHKSFAASPVAAGLITPIIGKRFNKAWELDTCLPVAKLTYSAIEKALGSDLLTPRTVIRIFNSLEEKALILNKVQQVDYKNYIEKIYPPRTWGNDSFGSVGICGGGVLNIPLLLAGIRKKLIAEGRFIEIDFDFKHIHFDSQKVYYNSEQYDAVIFCEGHHARYNPLFAHIVWRPAKGDILTVQAPLPKAWMPYVLNNGHWLIPQTPVVSRVGATYEWEWKDEPSVQSKQVLLTAFKALMPDAYMPVILEQLSGIRLATMDTKPCVQMHPTYSQAYIFNGFGSKGSLLIPYFAQQFWQTFTA